MRLLVVGMGSIARRHCRLLAELEPELEIVGLDPSFRQDFWLEQAPPPDRVASGWDEIADQRFDLALIATPTSFHTEDAAKAVAIADTVFVEKPLCVEPAAAEAAIAAEDRDRIVVGANMRFHPLAALLREQIAAAEGALAARFYSLSWLPDWHPWADYRTEYSARSELGGGVALDSIHELDLALHLLGPAADVEAQASTSGLIEVDVEDVARWLWRSGEALVTCDVSYVTRPPSRRVELQLGEQAFVVDWLQGIAAQSDGAQWRQVEAIYPAQGLETAYTDQWRAVLGGDSAQLLCRWDEAIAAVRLAGLARRLPTRGR